MKLALIGRSMISPFGFAIRPRMPGELADLVERSAGARVGHHEDRVRLVEVVLHRVGDRRRWPPSRSSTIALVALLLGDQAALVLRSTFATSLLVAARGSPPSSGGMTMSFFEIVMPARVA